MEILRASMILLFISQVSCTVPIVKAQPIFSQVPKSDTLVIKPIHSDTIIKEIAAYNDSIDSITTRHYKGLLRIIDQYYKRFKGISGFTYRYIPLDLFPYFCYKNELLPADKPTIFFDSFKYNLKQIKLTQFGGELVAIATVSYVKRKYKSPAVMTYRLNFYEYSAVTGDWRKSEYTTSVDFSLSKNGVYSNK